MEPLLVKPSMAAEMLSVSRSTVYEMMASGELPSLKVGASRLIETASLRVWIEGQRAATTAAR